MILCSVDFFTICAPDYKVLSIVLMISDLDMVVNVINLLWTNIKWKIKGVRRPYSVTCVFVVLFVLFCLFLLFFLANNFILLVYISPVIICFTLNFRKCLLCRQLYWYVLSVHYYRQNSTVPLQNITFHMPYISVLNKENGIPQNNIYVSRCDW